MHFKLDTRQDTLSLYTPFTRPGERIDYTRSVFVQHGSDAVDALRIMSINFALIVSVPVYMPMNAFLRTMIESYTREVYDKRSRNNECDKHSALYSQSDDHDNDKSPRLTRSTVKRLAAIDRQNRSDYEHCMSMRLFDDLPATEETAKREFVWFRAGDRNIEDIRYRSMSNINFIREVVEIEANNGNALLKEHTQYRILLDNHLIVHFFVEKFKYNTVNVRHDGEKHQYTIYLMDPICGSSGVRNQYDFFKHSSKNTSASYIERQLNCTQNPGFSNSLYFSNTYPYTGGLLHASLPNDSNPVSLLTTNSLHEMFKYSVLQQQKHNEYNKNEVIWDQSSAMGMIGKVIDHSKESASDVIKSVVKQHKSLFTISYNHFYIDLSENECIHLEYTERKNDILRNDPTPLKHSKKKKPSALTTNELRKKEKERTLPRNQPSLFTVISNIPETSKRKLSDNQPSDSREKSELSIQYEQEEQATKKLKSTVKQTTLSHFYSK